jgi:hypothetical protein
MTPQRKNSYILRNGYCLSYIQSLAKHQQHCCPSLCSYFMDTLVDRVGEVSLVKRAKYFYYTAESEFLMLISWTLVTVFMLIVVVFSNMIINILTVVLPTFITFFSYLWTGLLLKYYMLPFSLTMCLLGSFLLELFVEVIVLSRGGVTATNILCGVVITIVFVALVLGIIVGDVSTNPATWALLGTLIFARLLLLDESFFKVVHVHVCLPPLLAYVGIFGGW